MMGKGKRIPIAFTKDADAKDNADAIGEFIEKYDSQVNSEIINSKKPKRMLQNVSLSVQNVTVTAIMMGGIIERKRVRVRVN